MSQAFTKIIENGLPVPFFVCGSAWRHKIQLIPENKYRDYEANCKFMCSANWTRYTQ